MQAMKNLKETDGIYDIIVLSPGLSSQQIIFYVLLAIFFTLFLLLLFRKTVFSDKNRAIRNINTRFSYLKNHPQDKRKIAYEISKQVQDYLKLKQLSPAISLPAKLTDRQDDWQRFCNKMNAFKYQRQSNTTELNDIKHEAIKWIKIWP